MWDSHPKLVMRRAVLGLLSFVGLTGSAGAEQFVTFCDFHKRSYDDPIVYPGLPGANPHLHTFTGAVPLDHNSLPELLLGTDTTCDIDGDWSAYWAPTVFQNGVEVSAGSSATMRGMRVYYRLRGKSPTEIRPFPLGLRMIVGQSSAMSEADIVENLQPGVATTTPYSWSCSVQPYEDSIGLIPPEFDSASTTTDCVDIYGSAAFEADGVTPKPLRLRFIFPDCWDGIHLDTPDHKSHMAYSISGDCPSEHPVPLVGMTVATRFRLDGDFTNLSFDPTLPPAPGHVLSLYGGHADFMNGWDPILLERLVQECLVEGAACSTMPEVRPVLDPGTFPPGQSYSDPTAFTPVPAPAVPLMPSLGIAALAIGLVLVGVYRS